MGKKKIFSEEDIQNEKVESDSLADMLVEDLQKSLGDVSYILGGGKAPPEVNEWLSTGSIILDMLISNNPNAEGGIPVGRLVEIFGEEATGKSLVGYMILKDCQMKGGLPILIDTENSANTEFLHMLGLQENRNFIYVQADTTEEVFKAIETSIGRLRSESKNRLCAIVWDSVAATSTKAEMEGDVGDHTMALQARLIGQGLRKIIRYIGEQRIALIFLNQVRMKIGPSAMFGDPTTTPGGCQIASPLRMCINC